MATSILIHLVTFSIGKDNQPAYFEHLVKHKGKVDSGSFPPLVPRAVRARAIILLPFRKPLKFKLLSRNFSVQLGLKARAGWDARGTSEIITLGKMILRQL